MPVPLATAGSPCGDSGRRREVDHQTYAVPRSSVLPMICGVYPTHEAEFRVLERIAILVHSLMVQPAAMNGKPLIEKQEEEVKVSTFVVRYRQICGVTS